MDKNSIIGLVLMGVVVFGFMWLQSPSEEQRQQMIADKAQRDSIAQYENQQAAKMATAAAKADSIATVDSLTTVTDSTKLVSKYGAFAPCVNGEAKEVVLENENISLKISTKGGVISEAKLKKYNDYRGENVTLWNDSLANNSYSFVFQDNTREIDTKDCYFTSEQNDSTVTMTLNLAGGATWALRYTLPKDTYIVKMEMIQKGMENVIPVNRNEIGFMWHQKMRRQEKGKMFEERNSTIYYKYTGSSVEYLSETADDEVEETATKLQWIGFKNQFFSTALIADKSFNYGKFNSKVLPNDTVYLKDLTAEANLEYSSSNGTPATFHIFLGPNLYPLLSSYDDQIIKGEDIELAKLIPLGYKLFRWINTGVIIPVFTFLGQWISNYGVIILLLTLFIKLVLFPFTYKSLKSQAAMRVLAPDIKVINDKYPGQENAMTRQRMTMDLYSKAGANPMGGCLPMLLQMPILLAMFAFFPSSIELRGESFLWVQDLSSYDAIVSWDTYIPLITPYFGNHISLFCLLMTATNILYTYLNMQSQASSSSMPGMKVMMYMMPLMFLVFFNNYAAGLSYYYFISLLITIILTYAFRATVNEDKIKAKMAANAKKPKKKSGFMARLEEAQRQQQAALKAQQAGKKPKKK